MGVGGHDRGLCLAVAVLCEVCGTLVLRAAAGGRPRLYGVVALGYLLAFTLLSLALRGGIPLGVAYGVWAACGVALTAILSRVVYREPLTRAMLAGISLIIAGVLMIELARPV